MRYFHGSMDHLDVGTVMSGRGAEYDRDWNKTDFYSILESARPSNFLSHSEAVFAVEHPDDIDLAGGGTEWVFEIEADGPVTRHDLNWSSEISCLLSDGHDLESKEVLAAAANYWAGVPHPNEQVWEYLLPKATIILVEPYEDFYLDESVRPVFAS